MDDRVYPMKGSRSEILFSRAQNVMPGGNSRLAVFQTPYPIYISHAQGAKVFDADGVSRTDLINNQSVLIHGHRFPPAIAAVEAQLKRGTCFSGPSEAEVDLATALTQRSQGFQQVRFTNSGTEAVMVAVKAARAYTGRPKLAKCEGAYHGSYDFVEASRGSSPSDWGPPQRPNSVSYAKGTPDWILQNTVVFPYNSAALAKDILEPHSGELAAIIVEPVANRAGMIPGREDFIKFLRNFCSQHGIVLIFDEVYTYRLGVGGAQERLGVTGDLTTMGKVIGGGFPIGAVAGSSDVMSVFDARSGSPAVPHTGTFNANPISMVAGLETLKPMTAEFLDALNAKGDALRSALNTAFRKHGIDGQVTGIGSLFRAHFVGGELTDYRSAYPDAIAAKRTKDLHRLLLNAGYMVSVNCSGNLSSALTDADIEGFLLAFERSLPEAVA